MCPAARQLLLTALLVAVAAAGPLGGVGGEQVDRPCVPRDFGRGSVVCVCNATYCDEVPRPARSLLVPGRALVYTSSVDGLRFQRRQRSFTQQRPVTGGKTFEVTSNQRYQSIIGWGASLTDSAGINIQALSKAARKNLIRAYFSEGGIEYNLIRVPIGGTDCSTHKYTLHDVPGDQTLANFSLAMEDYKYKLPVLKSVRAQLAAGLQLLGSAWTAPPWMKTNNDYTGFGFLKEEYYQTWADYHVKFLDAYREHGFSFWGLTTGNEPMNGVAGPLIRFNSMGWTPFRMRDWIGDNLGPTVRAAGSPHANVRILTLDDQRIDLPWWVDLVMANENASKYTDGVAVHWYTNYFTPVLGLDLTHSHFPDKFILSTEASNGFNPWDEKVILGSWDRAEGYFDDILDNLNHWVTGWMEWSLVLDTEGGPSWSGNLVDTSILVNATADEFLKQPTFYAIGHFSKFLPPGSRRVLVEPERAGGVRTVAFIREDGITVVVLFNTKSKKETINIYDVFQGYLTLTLPPRSFNTVLYK